MNSQEALATQLCAMVAKAERALKAARRHLAEGEHDFASSKAYYAVFHMMQAALLTKGMTFGKHAGVISGFSQQFIKSGVFPAAFSDDVQRLRKNRELGDYGYSLTVDVDAAHGDLERATTIVQAVQRYVQSCISLTTKGALK